MKEITKPDDGFQLRCSDETIRAIHRWKPHFQLVYKREFTYEDVVIRALECLYYGELEVSNSLRQWNLEDTNKCKLLKKKQKTP